MLKLREIRKSRKMTMKQLGEIVGVTESAIGLYETGKRKPDYEMLLKLSDALGCSVIDLLDKNEKSPSIEDELAEELQILKDNPETRSLLQVIKSMTPDQVQSMREMILKMKEG